MAPPRTRAIFIEHQRWLGRGQADAVYIQEWMQKTAAQKMVWLHHLAAVEEDEAAKEELLPEWNAAWHQYEQAKARTFWPHLDGDLWRECHEDALEAAEKIEPVYQRLRAAYHNFFLCEQAQPVPSAAGVAYYTNQRWLCDNFVWDMQNVKRPEMNTNRNGPQPPLDPSSGRRRMPAIWHPMGLYYLLQGRGNVAGFQDDMSHDEVALLNAGPPTRSWEPWVNMSGGQSKGYLWLQYDDLTQQITDRVFRKDILQHDFQWTDPREWDGDVRNPNLKTPWELSCNHTLRMLGCRYVVRMREGLHRGLVNNDKQQYRVYLGWCPHTNLSRLIKQFKDENLPIPEPMIWNVAESLAVAGCMMAQGHVPGTAGAPNPQFEPIVHRDIKPGNIFLDSPDTSATGIYPQYPKVVLGDFGLAFRTRVNDPNNPHWYNTCGTPGFKPPEQMRWVDHTTLRSMLDNWAMSEKSDVFAVGMTLRALITKEFPKQPLFLGNGDNDTTLTLIEKPEALPYSATLRALIDDCVRYRPANRLTFQQLLQRIRHHTNETGQNRAKRMRSGTANATVRADNVVRPRDRYQIGFAMAGIHAQAL